MFAIVYRCRREGHLLDRDVIAADPARGELRLHRRGLKSRLAKLLGPDGERYVIPVLDRVRVLAINDKGILLAGMEVHPPRGSKGAGPIYPQTWWCVLKGGPEFVPASPAVSRAREREHQAHEVGRTMATYSRRR